MEVAIKSIELLLAATTKYILPNGHFPIGKLKIIKVM
jgi:hypothetical protein